MTDTTELSPRERISIAIARELNDSTTVLTGAASAVPLAACLLAQATHAPNLTILGAGVYINPRRLVPEFTAGWDCKPVAIGDMTDVFAITELGIDVMFYGGMQIDRYGCVNLHWVRTPSGRLRGPGLANTALGHTARSTILYTERHDRRTLVEQVDFASVVGHRHRGRSRAELGLPNEGPKALFTPDLLLRPGSDGTLTPDQALHRLDWDDVRQRTGWPLPGTPPETFIPTAGEIALLRGSIDPGGLLSGGL
ncbi:CoA synthetase [Streptomyces sp. NPDC056653]|uniref:CoA synthetase n=1 Tax=Streptomyces sp. NPDC056653 TaxID=3345894 RepID=UPI0036BA8F38